MSFVRYRSLMLRVLMLVVLAGISAAPAPANTILVLSDLQLAGSPAGQVTQPGWFAQDVVKFSGTTTLPLTPTASGSAAGITAALVAGGNWESRGGTAEGRDPVAGTSFNDVVSDLWVTRTTSFTATLSGLTPGQTYRIRTWHNDSYNINEGFATGGGAVQIAPTGATVVSNTSGTVTNRRGTQTDAAFGIASLTFIPTVSNPQIGYTRVGGGISAMPVNGVELTAIVVPEPTTAVGWISAVAVAAVVGHVNRRGRCRAVAAG